MNSERLYAEVNGKRQNRCVGGWQNYRIIAKEPSKGMLGSILFSIEVLSNDFADVDVREELCYHSRPKKQNSEWLRKTGSNGIFKI